MSLCLRIVHEPAGGWTVHGLANRPVAHLPSLAASIDYAREECAAAPATIELMIDGFYAVVHQRDGWPRQLVAAQFAAPCEAVEKLAGERSFSFKGWCDWAIGKRRNRELATETPPPRWSDRDHSGSSRSAPLPRG